MLYRSSREYPQAPKLLSSWRPAAGACLPLTQPSWKSLVHAAERLFSIVRRLVRRAMQTDDCTWLAAPTVPTGNARYEIMRIEARRRI